jgi:hypothetical protein
VRTAPRPPAPFRETNNECQIKFELLHFVTSGGVNPTSTIQALALYIADQMKQRLANLFD